MIAKSWKVYGMSGHRQKVAFERSAHYDFSGKYGRGTCLIDLLCADKTGTYDYVILKIECETAEECKQELDGQLDDGIFESARIGKVEEMED